MQEESKSGAEVLKQIQRHSNSEVLKKLIRKALIESGCKTAKVDKMLSNLSDQELPASLVQNWESMFKEDCQRRFRSDPDRAQGKHKNLDKLE
jgi:hypothetical protein